MVMGPHPLEVSYEYEPLPITTDSAKLLPPPPVHTQPLAATN